MKLIESKVEIISQSDYTVDGMYKMIELAGRTCYNSEDKITETSAKEFVDRMIKSGHGAMLEHGTVYLKMDLDTYLIKGTKYYTNPYSKTYKHTFEDGTTYVFITTNYRVLVENNWLDDLKYICEPTEYHEKRITVKWTTDRVTGESFLRHRVFSFARESTRYCNYSKDKFGNEIRFIKPFWFTENPTNDKECSMNSEFELTCEECEKSYFRMLKWGGKPQEARQVLPFSIYSPLVMTGFASDWKHFFELRCAPSAHPDAQKLAKELLVKLADMYPGELDDLIKKYIDNGEGNKE